MFCSFGCQKELFYDNYSITNVRILANFTNYLKSATIIPHADAALVNGSRIYLSANADQLALQV